MIKIERADGSFVDCDENAHTLSYYRYVAHFTDSEWIILKFLYLKKGQLVSREELVKALWGEPSPKSEPTRTIDVHISHIRRKLDYIKGARIEKIYGKGYKLVMLKRF